MEGGEGEGGGGEFSACTNFFFLLTACAGIVFSGETLCTIFFSDKYCFFRSEIPIHYLFCACGFRWYPRVICRVDISVFATSYLAHLYCKICSKLSKY